MSEPIDVLTMPGMLEAFAQAAANKLERDRFTGQIRFFDGKLYTYIKGCRLSADRLREAGCTLTPDGGFTTPLDEMIALGVYEEEQNKPTFNRSVPLNTRRLHQLGNQMVAAHEATQSTN